ncbi:MAG: pentapeptide repeat-containing protein [Chloroflexi bacterium]|nr:pentapeptide repeat-containing protein [Chloroflexota bacterium]
MIILVVAFVVIGIPALVGTGVLEFGFGDMTLKDWMQLLLIPLSIVVIGTLIQRSENRTDRRIAEERVQSDREIAGGRVQQETLNSYLDSMGTFIVNNALNNERGVQVMRARTAATIRVLANVEHRNAVFGFLRDAALLGGPEATGGDDDASGSHTGDAKLISVLKRIDLSRADLTSAFLMGADLSRAYLAEADLSRANLTGAYLTGADLNGADLTGAYLAGAYLTGAYLAGADLRGAVGTTNTQLAQAASIIGATFPDGTVIETEEQRKEFKTQYGWG